MPALLGVFEQPGHVAEAVRKLKGRGYTDLETYSPAPFAEIDDAVIEKRSGVRLYKLIGGLTGVVTGFALTLWMANDWQKGSRERLTRWKLCNGLHWLPKRELCLRNTVTGVIYLKGME